MTDTIVLPNEDTDWTSIDDDRDVAWGDPESYHGKLAAAYREAGWQPCYHDYGRTAFHFNVKVNGRWRVYEAALAKAVKDIPNLRLEVWDACIEQVSEHEMTWAWELMSDGNTEYLLNANDKDSHLRLGDTFWQGGRSGGWFEISNSWASDNPEWMLQLADYLRDIVTYYQSTKRYGDFLCGEAYDLYTERVYELDAEKVTIEFTDEAVKDLMESTGQLVSIEDARRLLVNKGALIEDMVAEFGMSVIRDLALDTTDTFGNKLKGI